jgi:hypothetical protein
MTLFKDLLTSESIASMDKFKESLPTYNHKSNERFNQISSMLRTNRITGVLLRADDRGNLCELVYAGDTYRPILINNNIHLKNTYDNIVLPIEVFISQIKSELAIIQQNSPDVSE